MARKRFTLCSGLSLLLCVAACVLWVGSYFSGDSAGYVRGGSQNPPRVIESHAIESAAGVLGVIHQRLIVPDLDAAERASFAQYASETPIPNGFTWWGRAPDRRVFLDFYPSIWNRVGFIAYSRTEQIPAVWTAKTLTSEESYVGVPHWLIAILTLVLPTIWLKPLIVQRIATWRTGNVGLCPTCGYDLRASKDRCPECGTPIAQKEATP